MGSSSPLREERRASLVMLQRLLLEAEGSIAAGRMSRAEATLGHIAVAFELFQSREEEEKEAADATSGSSGRPERWIALAKLIDEMDQLVSRADPKSLEQALAKTREAVEVCRGFDESHGTSGVRRRNPGEPHE